MKDGHQLLAKPLPIILTYMMDKVTWKWSNTHLTSINSLFSFV